MVLDTNYFKIPTSTDYLLTNRIRRSETYYKSKIRYDLEWRLEVKKKAEERGITLEEMIQIDAKYLFENSKVEKLELVKTE